MALMLSACVTSSEVPLKRDLPNWPSYGKTVQVQEPQEGDDPLAVAAQERAGRVHANRIILKLKEWYARARSSYAQPPKV